jgi:hypothetical protein
MIKLAIIVKGDKIETSFNEEEITLIEASMLVYELEKIILNFLDKDWDLEFGVSGEER